MSRTGDDARCVDRQTRRSGLHQDRRGRPGGRGVGGLTLPVRALSFEFTTIQRDVALAASTRCVALGYSRFNAALGETQDLVNADWVDGEATIRWLTALPPTANSGDVYAALS